MFFISCTFILQPINVYAAWIWFDFSKLNTHTKLDSVGECNSIGTWYISYQKCLLRSVKMGIQSIVIIFVECVFVSRRHFFKSFHVWTSELRGWICLHVCPFVVSNTFNSTRVLSGSNIYTLMSRRSVYLSLHYVGTLPPFACFHKANFLWHISYPDMSKYMFWAQFHYNCGPISRICLKNAATHGVTVHEDPCWKYSKLLYCSR